VELLHSKARIQHRLGLFPILYNLELALPVNLTVLQKLLFLPNTKPFLTSPQNDQIYRAIAMMRLIKVGAT
jgi:hypothetical protein